MLLCFCHQATWLGTMMQGCSLGLDVSVSRRSRDAFSQRLGLVSVSGLRVSFTSDNFLIGSKVNNIFLHSISSPLLLNFRSKDIKVAFKPLPMYTIGGWQVDPGADGLKRLRLSHFYDGGGAVLRWRLRQGWFQKFFEVILRTSDSVGSSEKGVICTILVRNTLHLFVM